MKNVTLSMPEELLEKSREYARQHGTSLNEFIRQLLTRFVMNDKENPVERLLQDSEELEVSTKKWKWNRDGLYDREIFS